MDLRTGKMYGSMEEGVRAGVPESDLMELTKDMKPVARIEQTLRFRKSPFATIHPRKKPLEAQDA